MPVTSWFKMPSLSGPEYHLGKALAEKYELMQLSGIPNWTELVATAFRVMYEVSLYHSEDDRRGEQWIHNIINEYKKTPSNQRRYEKLL